MSRDYHQQQEFFSFTNGFERSAAVDHPEPSSEIGRDRLRVNEYDPHPPPLVGLEEDPHAALPGFEPAGMLSEIFNFPSGGTQVVSGVSNWYGNRQDHQVPTINTDSATAMQLFLMNPTQPRPSPSTDFSWSQGGATARVAEAQGLSLSLSSLQHLEAAKAEQLFYNQGQSSSSLYPYKSSAQNHNHQQQQQQQQQLNIGFGSSLTGNVMRNSKYVKAAQELLEEFCSVGRGQFKKNKSFGRGDGNVGGNNGGGGGGLNSLSSKEVVGLTAADRIEHQRRKAKLLSMVDEVDRRYNRYCEQMQMVVNSFDLILGYGSATPYTALAQKAMSRHFRCLKDAVVAQLKHSCELLGEKDGAGGSGITKGETPRLKLLEQSLRQQRAFHQMGMMDQEAWRPQRGLPERSVNILRAWLFEHFLHPYPSDADKHLLSRQTGLSRNQVSNWFINARVRLWKPMVEEMYQQESKEGEDGDSFTQPSSTAAQLSPPPESDPSSLVAVNTHFFSETPAAQPSTQSNDVAPLSPLSFPTTIDDTRHRGSMVTPDYEPTSVDPDCMGSTLMRFGTTSGEVSLTLGLRHAGNQPEQCFFSVRDFGGC